MVAEINVNEPSYVSKDDTVGVEKVYPDET
jgi:hypothetical protein